MTLHRSTFGVLGVPIDPFGIDEVISEIDHAISNRKKILISTVNANFLANSAVSKRFRLSLLRSDMCTVDGIGMLLMCRLALVHHISRVSGADVMEYLLSRDHTQIGRPLRVFFFGGNTQIADRARHIINKRPSTAICCVGSLNPGFGSLDELSSPALLKIINDAHPDFLIVSLGAERGQEWLLRNLGSLNVSVSAHLGAAVNFVAGSIIRAPRRWQRLGFEWLWRIRQEPLLARRYWRDGLILLRLLLFDALPQTVVQILNLLLQALWPQPAEVEFDHQGRSVIIRVSGALIASAAVLDAAFLKALDERSDVTLDCRQLKAIDAEGVGAIMRFERDLEGIGFHLHLLQAPRQLRRQSYLTTVVAR